MATTVHEPPEIESRPTLSHDGGWHDLIPSTGNILAVEDSSPASRTGIWVALAAITMTFVAITSAMVVRQGASMDWRHFTLPRVLYLDTVILLASSGALELARKRVAAFARGLQPGRSLPLLWLWLTLGLGLLFVGGQYVAWLQLKAEGWYLATNPSSSFFYLFTAHAWPACARGPGGSDVGDLAVQQAGFDSAPEHAEYGFVLLAFHGCALDLPAGVTVGANLTSCWEEAL